MKLVNENDTTILLLEGDIQGQQVEELSQTLEGLKAKQVERVALDMSNVGYIYSRGIGILVRAQKSLQETGGSLYLYNLKSSVQKILMEINLMDYLNGFGTKEEMEFEFFRSNPGKEEASLELGLHIACTNSTTSSVTFSLTGTIDSEHDLQALSLECEQKINAGCIHIILDLSDLIYVDDRGVHEWKSLSDKLFSKKGTLTLTSMNEIILDQLKIMGLQSHFILN